MIYFLSVSLTVFSLTKIHKSWYRINSPAVAFASAPDRMGLHMIAAVLTLSHLPGMTQPRCWDVLIVVSSFIRYEKK